MEKILLITLVNGVEQSRKMVNRKVWKGPNGEDRIWIRYDGVTRSVEVIKVLGVWTAKHNKHIIQLTQI